MSSRALRKLQKEQEVEKQLTLAREAEEVQFEEPESDPEPMITKPKNAFDMLEDMEDEDSGDQRGYETPQKDGFSSDLAPAQSSKAKRKKKSKKKGKAKTVQPSTKEAGERFDMDEIDRALKELAVNNAQARAALANNLRLDEEAQWESSATKLLAIDSRNLNPVNEMKSLFGDIAVEAARSRSPRPPRDHLQQGLDLGTALTGRHSPASKGKELGGALAGRRNVFIQGKEEWPLATSGGLSMEYQLDRSSVGKKYNIIHSHTYQETQGQFRTCVNSMDPQNLVSLLMLNPYHIATLLQVSEFAKVQGDHSVSGDLLERALFTFGRSVHSTFGIAFKDGTARISFESSQNREMYLSIWRYIRNLEMRGTWKTAFEWAKMLLQFNMLQDPYGMTLAIDHLAIKGRRHAALIELCAADAYGKTWVHLPNIQISLALAYHKSNEPKSARTQLAFAMQNYPYILARLIGVLEIDRTPEALWGKLPTTEAEKLYTELYVTRAKDLWNTPEYMALLVEVAETLDRYPAPMTAPPILEISLEDARHIMLLEIPHLIALLPRAFTRMQTSSSDVLPPPSDQHIFTARAPQSHATGTGDGVGMGLLQSILGTVSASATDMMERVLSLFSDQQPGSGMIAQQNALMQAGAELGMQPEEMQNVLVHLLLQEGERARDTPGGWPDGEETSSISLQEAAYDSDDNSMPELEDMTSATSADRSEDTMNVITAESGSETVSRNPRAARVEEGEEDSTQLAGRSAPTSGALLRHADSEDEDPAGSFSPQDTMAHPDATHTIYAPTSTRASQTPSFPADETPLDTPERVQRWLLSTGFTAIQAGGELGQYVQRLQSLPPQHRIWILRMVEQRGGKELAVRVKQAAGLA